MDKQDVYNRVKAHLLTQNEVSFIDGTCAYRGDGGLKCAVGALITDEAMAKIPDCNTGTWVRNGKVVAALKESGIDCNTVEDCEFLSDLQMIHDVEEVEDWEEELKLFAAYLGLTP